MSESDGETPGIEDDQLPEDLQPGEDNPLAEPLEDDVDPDELDVRGGKRAAESESADDGESDGESAGESDGEG